MTLEFGQPVEAPPAPDTVAPSQVTVNTPPPKEEVAWSVFLEKASDDAIRERLSAEIPEVLKICGLEHDCCLALYVSQF